MESLFEVLNSAKPWSSFGALAMALKVIVRQSCCRSMHTAFVQ
jgi:hypothetical protein